MSKYDLDKTWELCLAQRAWIAEQIENDPTLNMRILKTRWMKDNGFEDEDIAADCFFCEYAIAEPGCGGCPGRLVDPGFKCTNAEYHHRYEPLTFNQKLLEMDKMRKEQKEDK